MTILEQDKALQVPYGLGLNITWTSLQQGDETQIYTFAQNPSLALELLFVAYLAHLHSSSAG
jgi:hypothetical protein